MLVALINYFIHRVGPYTLYMYACVPGGPKKWHPFQLRQYNAIYKLQNLYRLNDSNICY